MQLPMLNHHYLMSTPSVKLASRTKHRTHNIENFHVNVYINSTNKVTKESSKVLEDGRDLFKILSYVSSCTRNYLDPCIDMQQNEDYFESYSSYYANEVWLSGNITNSFLLASQDPHTILKPRKRIACTDPCTDMQQLNWISNLH